jgi:PAS domain S-box-containing protein
VDRRGQLTARLDESEQRFLRLADSAPVMVWVSGLDKGCTYFNRRWLDFTGRSLQQELGNGWASGVHREDFERCLEIYTQAFDARRGFSMEYRLRHHTGEYRWISDTGAPVFGSHAIFEGYVGSCVDVSEQKKTEEALRQSESKFRVLFESNMMPLAYWHADGRILDANDAYLSMIDFSREELRAGRVRWESLTPAEHLDLDQRAFEELASGRDSSTPYEKEYVLRNGTRVPVFMSRTLLPGHKDRGVAFAIDLTERKRTERRLRESREMVSSVVASLYGHVAVLDREGNIIAVNDEWLRLVRDNRADEAAAGVGASYLQACHRAVGLGGENAEAVVAGIEAVLNGFREHFSMEYTSQSHGVDRWYEMIVNPLHRPEGGAIVSHIDITARRRAEVEAQRLQQELSHLARVSTMGELSASLAHELNQPLTAILTNAQVAQRLIASGNPDMAELCEILADIVADDQRAGEVVHRVRSLIHKGSVEVKKLDLNGVVWDVVRLVRSEALIKDVKVVLELSPSPVMIRGDRIQMQQVLLNLIINGLEAIKEADSGDGALVVRTAQADDQWVQVTVEDTGAGIDDSALERIFQPFHTSKTKGMGMGLSICRSIVQAHGGRIWAERGSERGAELHVLLPLVPDA